ncbi:MAG: hypothetical protein ACEPOV_13035 [Hyphomicrobiales bacterium]
MLSRSIYVFMFSMVSLFTFGQSNDTIDLFNVKNSDYSLELEDNYRSGLKLNDDPGFNLSNNEDKLKVNTVFSTSVTSDFRGGAAVNTKINPNFSYAVKPKFRVHFGMDVNNMYLSNIGHNLNNELKPFNDNIWYTNFYVGGTYIFNEKLSMSGTVYKTVTMNPQPKMNPNALNFDQYGGNVNIRYSPSEKLTIEAQIDYNKNQGNIYPYNHYNMFMNPASRLSPLYPLTPFY